MKNRLALLGAVGAILLAATVAWAFTYQTSGSDRYLPNGTFALYDNSAPPVQIGTMTISGVTSHTSGGSWTTHNLSGTPTGSGAFTWGGTNPNEGGLVYDASGAHIADFVAPVSSNTYCRIQPPGGGLDVGYFQ